MPRIDAIRAEIQRLIRAVPFRRFLLVLESGDRVLIEHPENIAFDPDAREPGADEFYVITGRIRLFSTFGAVSSIGTSGSKRRRRLMQFVHDLACRYTYRKWPHQ